MTFARNYVRSREIIARGKPRIVVAPQPLVYGMFRAYQTYTEASGVGPTLVRRMSEALSLLRLDSPVFGPEPWTSLQAEANDETEVLHDRSMKAAAQ
jgi:hypothetical protein